MSKGELSSLSVSIFSFFQPGIWIEIDVQARELKIKQFPEIEPEIRCISKVELLCFLERIKKANFTDWREDYPNELGILDGTQWTVSVIIDGKNYQCSGDNNFPIEWNKFCRAINKLTKHNYLE